MNPKLEKLQSHLRELDQAGVEPTTAAILILTAVVQELTKTIREAGDGITAASCTPRE